MTKSEACERYRIPPEILSEYESWGLCGAVRQVMGGCCKIKQFAAALFFMHAQCWTS